jgi:hypothetical protein
MFCQQQVAELRPHVEELRHIGVEPYVVGSGSPQQAQQFAEHMNAGDLPIFSDKSLASYRAAGFKRSAVATILHPASWLRGARVAWKYRQGRTMGDPWQLGGALLVRTDGSVNWRFRSESSGEHPTIPQLLDEARRAVA